MTKKKTTTKTAQATTSDFPKTLKGKTPEEVAEQLDNLEAPEGATLYTGVICRSIEDGTYTVRVNLNNN